VNRPVRIIHVIIETDRGIFSNVKITQPIKTPSVRTFAKLAESKIKPYPMGSKTSVVVVDGLCNIKIFLSFLEIETLGTVIYLDRSGVDLKANPLHPPK